MLKKRAHIGECMPYADTVETDNYPSLRPTTHLLHICGKATHLLHFCHRKDALQCVSTTTTMQRIDFKAFTPPHPPIYLIIS